MTSSMVIDRSGTQSERQATAAAEPAVRTILLHVANGPSLDGQIEAALSLARRCSAHLSCVQVTPFEAYVAFDNFGGVFVMKDVMKALDAEEEQLRRSVEEKLRGEDVSWDYSQATGSIPRIVTGHASLADIVIVGRSGHRHQFDGSSLAILGDILHWSRTPLLIPGDDGRSLDPGGVALIAWDGSFQAANAVRSSVPMLKLAADVRVLQIHEEEKREAFPGTRVLEYLSRHGIHAELHTEPKRGRMNHDAVTGMLLTHAQAAGAAYIVLGAYSHSRIGEFVFGGVTRSLLSSSPVPLLLAH